jgi:hypothetical protein
MNDDPAHLMNAYVKANARAENANEATNGAPPFWNVLARIEPQVAISPIRVHVSVLVRLDIAKLAPNIVK